MKEDQKEGDLLFQWMCPACGWVSKYASRFWKADREKCVKCGEADYEYDDVDPKGMILIWDELEKPV
jgi:uncharacterized protein (DUF983 family)